MAKKKRASNRQPGLNKRKIVIEALAKDPDASPTALSQKFAQDGIEISALYISNIKSSLKREAATGEEQAGETSENGVKKTQAIKEYFWNDPKAKPRQAADDLTEKYGVEFRTTTISAIKHQMKKAGELRKRRTRQPAEAGDAKGGRAAAVGFDDLLAAKEMAQRFGSIEKAREALEAFARLVK